MNQKGEANNLSKLTEQQVLEIRKIWAQNMSAKQLAARYGVKPLTIYKIVNQQSWKHLPSVIDFIYKGD